MNKIFTFFFISILFLTGCYKDNNQTETTTLVEYPETFVESAGVSGSIVYHDGSLAEIQNIQFNGNSSTSEKPYFLFEAEFIRQFFEVLTISLENGHTLYYPLNSVANSVSHHTIIVPELTQVTSIIDSILELAFQSGARLTFENISFMEDEEPISTPEVYFEEILGLTIPGSSQGLSINQQAILLVESDIFYLGWENSNISMLGDFVSDENSSKALYFLNPQNGMWEEHEKGSIYRPGFYAHAKSLLAEAINIDIKSQEINNLLELQLKVKGELLSTQPISSQSTLTAFVPLENEFEVIVKSGDQPLAAESLFISMKEDVEIKIESSGLDKIKIFASALDCDGNRISNSILEVTTSAGFRRSIPLVHERIQIIRPPSDKVSLRLISGVSDVSTISQVYENESTIILGRQILCDSFGDEFLYYHTEGHRNVLSQISIDYIGDYVQIDATNEDMEIVFNLVFEVQQEGAIQDSKINILLDSSGQGAGFKVNCSQSTVGCGFEDFNVTLFKSPGNPYMKAVFEGEFWMESLADNNVGYRWLNGEFQVKLP